MIARIGYAVGGLLFGCALVVAIELALRVLGVAADEPRHDPFAGFSSSVPVFEPRQREDGTPMLHLAEARTNPAAPKDFEEPQRELRAEKQLGTYRIFVIGSSSAAGVPYSTRYAFSSWLERRLHAALPDVPVEVVNLGMAGYASRRLLRIAHAIAEQKPDLLIIYMGHNEWAEAMYYQHLLSLDPRLFRVLEAVYETRLYRLASRLSGLDDRVPREIELDATENSEQMFHALRGRAEGHGYPTERELAYRDALYETNLRDMVRTAQRAGAQVMILTLSQNFSDWPPPASRHRENLSDAELAAFEAALAEGVRLAEEDQCAQALDAYRRALAIDPGHAELHFGIARCLDDLGDAEEAWREYRLASDLDPVPHGAPTHFNDIMRTVADEEGAMLVDIDQVLAQESGANLVGDDLFVDFAHPNLRGHQLIARTVAERMRAAGIPASAGAWRDGYVDPDPEAVIAKEPRLRTQELASRVAVCLLAPRAGCQEEAQRLAALDPTNPAARLLAGRSSKRDGGR